MRVSDLIWYQLGANVIAASTLITLNFKDIVEGFWIYHLSLISQVLSLGN